MKTVIEMAQEIATQYSKAERFQTWTHDFMMQRLMELVAASAADEREACAQIVETPVGEYEVVVACGGDPTQRRIPMYLSWNQAADAIRARGETSLRSNT